VTAKHSLLIHTLLYGMAGGSKQRLQLKANADDANGPFCHASYDRFWVLATASAP